MILEKVLSRVSLPAPSRFQPDLASQFYPPRSAPTPHQCPTVSRNKAKRAAWSMSLSRRASDAMCGAGIASATQLSATPPAC
eukprot:47850-Rhodomonas_salina.3